MLLFIGMFLMFLFRICLQLILIFVSNKQPTFKIPQRRTYQKPWTNPLRTLSDSHPVCIQIWLRLVNHWQRLHRRTDRQIDDITTLTLALLEHKLLVHQLRDKLQDIHMSADSDIIRPLKGQIVGLHDGIGCYKWITESLTVYNGAVPTHPISGIKQLRSSDQRLHSRQFLQYFYWFQCF